MKKTQPLHKCVVCGKYCHNDAVWPALPKPGYRHVQCIERRNLTPKREDLHVNIAVYSKKWYKKL
jgi:hypothetical protein